MDEIGASLTQTGGRAIIGVVGRGHPVIHSLPGGQVGAGAVDFFLEQK